LLQAEDGIRARDGWLGVQTCSLP